MEGQKVTQDGRRELLEWSVQTLRSAGVDHPDREARSLLEEALVRGGGLSAGQEQRFRDWVVRRAAREPLYYIIGHRTFWSLPFKVNQHVLIPRPETEVLIEAFLRRVPEARRNEPFEVLDVCTGSGIIAVVAARELPHSRVTAVDISGESLDVARENAERHGVADRVRFLQGDLFEPVLSEGIGDFDFILSNPPYIGAAFHEDLVPEFRDHEPKRTFDGGKDGMRFYRVIVPGAARLLKPGGHLILETGFGVHGPVADLVNSAGCFETPDVIDDFNRYPRVVSAKKREARRR